MKPIAENVVIQIEITNACHLSCANCSRLVGHHRKPFFMTPQQVRDAIASLDGFPGRVGMMGGEPALHPDFVEICKIYQEMIPDKRRRELWTAGYKWEEYRDVIRETFEDDLVHYNDHSKPEEGWHQPLLISIDEVVEDKLKMWKLIDNCWVQRRWSASITTKGAYFCEVAAAIDHALSGPGGWKIEKDWWKRIDEDYAEQKKRTCLRCSAALPLAAIPNNHMSSDMMSKGNLELLQKADSPKVKAKRFQVVSQEDSTAYLNSSPDVTPGVRGYLESHPDWRPSEFRTKVWHGPGEGVLTGKEVLKLQRNQEEDALEAKGLENRKVAQIGTGPYTISDLTLTNASREIDGDKLEGLSQIVGIEFATGPQLYASLDSCTGNQLTLREKDVVLKFINEEKSSYEAAQSIKGGRSHHAPAE